MTGLPVSGQIFIYLFSRFYFLCLACLKKKETSGAKAMSARRVVKCPRTDKYTGWIEGNRVEELAATMRDHMVKLGEFTTKVMEVLEELCDYQSMMVHEVAKHFGRIKERATMAMEHLTEVIEALLRESRRSRKGSGVWEVEEDDTAVEMETAPTRKTVVTTTVVTKAAVTTVVATKVDEKVNRKKVGSDKEKEKEKEGGEEHKLGHT